MLKTLAIAIAFATALLATPAYSAATCDLYYQYDYSKQLVIEMTESKQIVGSYIVEGTDKADAFLAEVNSLTGSVFPMGTADAILALVIDSDGVQVMMIFGYKDGCQIANAQVLWPVDETG